MLKLIPALALCLASVAQASVIFVHTSDGETIDLHDKPEQCKTGTFLVVYTQADKTQHRGCWKVQAGRVLIRWDDGDYGVMQPESFRKVEPT